MSGWAGGTGETPPCPFLVPPGASPALTQSLGKGTELTPGLWQQAVSAKGVMFSHERGQGGPGRHLDGTPKGLPGPESWEARGCPDVPSLPTPRTPGLAVWCLLGTQTSRQPCRHPAAGQMGSGFCRFNTLPAWELRAWSHSRHLLDQRQDRSAPSTGQNITIPVLGAAMVIRDMLHPAM